MSRSDALGNHLHGGVLVELVMRAQALLDTQMLKQVSSRTGILREDEIDVAQHVYRTQRDVVHIADGRGNYVELGHILSVIFAFDKLHKQSCGVGIRVPVEIFDYIDHTIV